MDLRYRKTWHWQLQQQWVPILAIFLSTSACHDQHSVPTKRQVEDHPESHTLQTLTSSWLHSCTPVIWGVLLYYTLVRCLVRIATAFTGLFTLKLPSPLRSIVHKRYRDESWIPRETGWKAQKRGRRWTRTPVVTSESSAPGDHGISRSRTLIRRIRFSNPRPCWKQTILLPTASSKTWQLSSKTAFKHGCSVPQTNKVTLQAEWLVDSSCCINTATWWCRGHALIQAAHRSADGTILLTDKEVVMKHWSKHFGGLFSDKILSWCCQLVRSLNWN